MPLVVQSLPMIPSTAVEEGKVIHWCSNAHPPQLVVSDSPSFRESDLEAQTFLCTHTHYIHVATEKVFQHESINVQQRSVLFQPHTWR